MIKQERIDRYREALLQRDHVAMLVARFGLGLDAFTFRALEGGEDNLNILVGDADGRGVAVARHYLVTPPGQVSAELDFVRFLADHGFPTPAPLRTTDGAAMLTDDPEASIAMFPFVAGEHIESWPAAQLRTGGRMLARMHGLCEAHGYRIGRPLERERTLREGLATVAESALRDTAPFLAEVERFLAEDFPAGAAALAALPCGPIHHDLNSGNVLWRGGDLVALIDFDEAQDAPYVTDLVMAFHYLAIDDGNRLVDAACRDLIAGYREERRLVPAELDALQFCWDYSNLVGAMEFITGNLDYLDSALECRSYSELYLLNRGRLQSLS